MRLQNFTAQMISNVYKTFANEYRGLSNQHSLSFDLTQALHKNLSVEDDANIGEELSEKFAQMSPENMSEAEFKKFFKAVFKKDYKEEVAKDLMTYCIENPQLDITKDKKFREKLANLYDKNSADLLSGVKKLKVASKVGDVTTFLYMGVLLHNSAPVTKFGKNVSAFNESIGLDGMVNKAATGFTVSAATMGTITAGYGTVDNLLRGNAVSAGEWVDLAGESIKVMPIGGIFGTLDVIAVAPVLQKMAPNCLKAADSLLADGCEHSMKDILKTFYGTTTKEELTKVALGFGQILYTGGVYGAATTTMNVGADLIKNGTENIPEGEFLKYLGEQAKANFTDQGLMTFMSLMLSGRIGGNAANQNQKGLNKTLDLPEFKIMDDAKIQQVTINGQKCYKINGRVINGLNSIADVMSACHLVAGTCVQHSNLNVENNPKVQPKESPISPKMLVKPKSANEPEIKDTHGSYEAPQIRVTDIRLEDDAMSSMGADSGTKRGLFGVFRGIIDKYTSTQPQTKTEPVKSKDIQTPTKKAVYDKPLPQDSPIYRDIHKLSDYLAQKFDAQAANISSSEIDTMVKTLSSKYNVPENVVLSIMSKLTQFGSYNQLCVLGQKLKDLGVESFYVNAYTYRGDLKREVDLSDKANYLGVSTNISLNYIHRKKHHFDLAQFNSTRKQAFVLDDASLKYLENLKQSGSPEFDAIIQNINDGNLILVNLDGTGLQIDGNYFSYTALDGGVNLQHLTEAVLQQTNGKAKNIDKALNGSYQDRVQAIFGTDIANKVENINIESTEITSQTIAKQIRQNTPTATDIEISLNAIIDEKLGANCSPTDRATAVQTLGKYYDNFAEIYSNEGMVELLQQQHSQVEQIVKQLGKSMDDVVYLAPYLDKSYGLIAQMYAKANNIPMENFDVFRIDGMELYKAKPKDIPDGKVIVFIDDVIGSGESALGVIDYSKFVKTHPNSNIIFASLSTAESGQKNINYAISSASRNGKDFLLQNVGHQFQIFDSRYNASDMPSNKPYIIRKNTLDDLQERGEAIPDFLCLTEKEIEDINSGKSNKVIVNGRIPSCFTEIKEVNMFIKLVGDYFGHGDNGLCTAFPHMVPDNVTNLAAPLFLYMYNNTSVNGPLEKSMCDGDYPLIKKIVEQNNKQ